MYVYNLLHITTCKRLIIHVGYRLAKISILTSNVPLPETPSNSSSDWTFKNYRNNAYGDVGTIDFNPPIEAQHVAVISTAGRHLALAEVMVFGMLY